jgi:hypothetical protein
MVKSNMNGKDKTQMALEFVEKNVKSTNMFEAGVTVNEKLAEFTPCETLYVAVALVDEAIKQLEENQVHGLGQNWIEVAKLVKQTIVTLKAFVCDVQDDAESKVTVCEIVKFAIEEDIALEKVLSQYNSVEANMLKKYLKYLECVLNAVKTVVCKQ